MIIRKLEEKDIDQVIYLEEHILSESVGKELLMESIAKDYYHFYVLDDKDIIGYISTCILGSQTEIYNFLIKEEFQRKGYGQHLLNKIIDDSIKNNSDSIILEVRYSNLKAINFYLKNGFKIISVRKQYYSNGDDAYLMLKEL